MSIPYKYAVGLTAALGLFMAVLDNTIVNVALTAMQRAFDTDVNTIQWVVTGYFLSQAAVIPIAGYLGNRYGSKRVFIFSLVTFTVGSLLCGLSPQFAGSVSGENLLIAFRIFQGIGGGMLFPLAASIAFGAFPPAERAAASGVVGIPVLLAPALGPTVGGLIVDSNIGWEGIFFINIPVGILAFVLIWRVLKPDPPHEKGAGLIRGFDWVGLVTSMLGVVLVVYGFTLVSRTRPGTITRLNPRGDIYGWTYWQVWAFVAAGLVILGAFALYETLLSRDPVLDLKLFRSYDFAIGTIMTWIIRATVFGSFLLLPLFFQQVQGKSALDAGLILLPQGLASAIGIAVGSRLYDRIGPRALVILGMAILAGSTFWLSQLRADSSVVFFIPILLLRGLGFGWVGVPLQTSALGAITGRALPKANSLYNATAQIFSSVGTAVVITLFIEHAKSHATKLVSAAVNSGSRPPANVASLAGGMGMSDVFQILGIITVAGLFVGLLLPRQSLAQRGAAAKPAEAQSDRYRLALLGVVLAYTAQRAQDQNASSGLLRTLADYGEDVYPDARSIEDRGRAVARDVIEPMALTLLLAAQQGERLDGEILNSLREAYQPANSSSNEPVEALT